MSPSYRLPADRYLEAIRRESARFGAVLADVDPRTPVATCPEWDAADLLWHLTEVQWFWSTLVAERPQGPEVTGGRRPERPESYAELGSLFRRCSAGLADALGAASPDDAAWTWLETDQSVGFSFRRQAHEALIHRLDAEIVANDRTPLDAELATDGIDEALQIMFGGIPGWATFTREHGPVGVRTTNTSAAWSVDVGRQTGAHPGSGAPVDDVTLCFRDEDAAPVAEIAADAATLDAWLWGRAGTDAIGTSGDEQALAAFAAVIRTGIE